MLVSPLSCTSPNFKALIILCLSNIYIPTFQPSIFVSACRSRGIMVPIIPGIMCISTYGGFKVHLPSLTLLLIHPAPVFLFLLNLPIHFWSSQARLSVWSITLPSDSLSIQHRWAFRKDYNCSCVARRATHFSSFYHFTTLLCFVRPNLFRVTLWIHLSILSEWASFADPEYRRVFLSDWRRLRYRSVNSVTLSKRHKMVSMATAIFTIHATRHYFFVRSNYHYFWSLKCINIDFLCMLARKRKMKCAFWVSHSGSKCVADFLSWAHRVCTFIPSTSCLQQWRSLILWASLHTLKMSPQFVLLPPSLTQLVILCIPLQWLSRPRGAYWDHNGESEEESIYPLSIGKGNYFSSNFF